MKSAIVAGAACEMLLIRQIKRELKTGKHCAIYEEDLSRVWREDGKGRELQIAQFAKDNGLRLRFYRAGLCAIFDKEPEKRTRARASVRL